MLLKHLHLKGRTAVDWARWRHNTIAQRGPALARAGPAKGSRETLVRCLLLGCT